MINNEMSEYLYCHNYISNNKKSDYQKELSIERAACIANKHQSIMETEFKMYLLDKIVESTSKRDKADEYLSKEKKQEARTIFYVAGIRADERINVYEELLRKIGE